MARIKLEKVTGVVALAYLLIIPAGAYYVWRKVQLIDNDVTELWLKTGMPDGPRPAVIDLNSIFKGLRAK